MKKLLFCGLLLLCFFTVNAQYGTERTGYEGDYFSLQGALDLFKSSSTLRDFERKLNSERYWVNNLDLDYDGRIDYIRVEHRQQGNFHAIILQDVVDRYEVQDVAVIEIEVIGRGEAILQIIGDEDLYGEEVYIEPVEGYADSRSGYSPEYGNYVNVYYWESVQYILGRQYRVYVSPYRWNYYPTWWAPRIQIAWSVFRPRISIYFRHFHVVRRHRLIRVHHFYRPYRSYCHAVVQHANKVRVRHGKSPIHRPAHDRGRGPSHYSGRSKVVERSRSSARSDAPRQQPDPISRKRTESATARSDVRSSTPRTNHTVERSGVSRSGTGSTYPPLSRKRTESTTSRSDMNRSTPRSSQSDRSSTGRTGISRSGSGRKDASISRKKTPTSTSRSDLKRGTSRSTHSSRAPISRSKTSSSRTSTRSGVPSRKPSVNTRKSTSSSRSKAGGKPSSKKGSVKSRRGGG